MVKILESFVECMAVLQVAERNKSSQRRQYFRGNSGSHFEESVDEPILTQDSTPLSHRTWPFCIRLMALNRLSRSLEFARPLFRVHSPVDRAMAGPWIDARSVFVTWDRGWDRSLSALRNSRVAVSASRNADNRESMAAPAGSIGGTGSTSGLSPEGKFHRPATTCWSAPVPAQSLL
jgi:hypothetical protein